MTGVEIALAAGTAMSAMASVASAVNQANVSRYNAKVGEANARQAILEGDAQASRTRDQVSRALGDARARAGASNLDLSGSTLDVLADSAAEGEMDALIAQYHGQMTARQQRSQASLDKSQASAALTTGALKAGSTLLTAYGKFGREPPTVPQDAVTRAGVDGLRPGF